MKSLKSPYVAFWVVWAVATTIVLARTPLMAALAGGGCAYAMLLALAAVRLLPPPPATGADPILCDAPLPFTAQRRFRLAIAAALLLFTTVCGFAFTGLSRGGVYVPLLSHFVADIRLVRTPLNFGLSPIFNFAYLAVIPGLLLALAGASRASLGLTPWRRGTLRVLGICLILPAGMAIVTLLRGGATLATLALLCLHNLVSNGFSEEFFARAVLMSQLRAWLSNEWSLVIQAMLFAAIHFGGSYTDDPNKLVVLATVIALNAPVGLALGIMALRSRSIALPALVHTSLDTMGTLVGAR